MRAACLFVGAAAGAAAAAAAFFYDGGGRVNVLLVLALFVLLPLATLALFAAASASRHGFAGISSGHLGRGITALLPGAGARALAGLAAGRAGPGVAKWLLLGWSQWLALGYSAGALAMAVALVLFTDLAFGWATTLDLDPARVSAIAHALALPWAWALPGAVPDAALVEASRYFRLAFAGARTGDPALLARWWPFVVMAMLCYGVLPRLAALALVRWRLAAACTAAALADRRVRELLERMNTPLVETRSDEREHAPAPATTGQAAANLPPAPGWQVVNWAGVPVDEAHVPALLGTARMLSLDPAGGSRSTAEDRALGERLGRRDAAVLVLAKAWEPPTLELMDFLGDVAAALPARQPLALAPVMVHDGAARAPDAARGETWLGALAASGLQRVDLVRPGGAHAP